MRFLPQKSFLFCARFFGPGRRSAAGGRQRLDRPLPLRRGEARKFGKRGTLPGRTAKVRHGEAENRVVQWTFSRRSGEVRPRTFARRSAELRQGEAAKRGPGTFARRSSELHQGEAVKRGPGTFARRSAELRQGKAAKRGLGDFCAAKRRSVAAPEKAPYARISGRKSPGPKKATKRRTL